MKKIFFTCLVFIAFNLKPDLFAQKIVDKTYFNWYFGSGVGLNFNTPEGKPQVLKIPVQNMRNEERAMSISDSSGNIIFYYCYNSTF